MWRRHGGLDIYDPIRVGSSRDVGRSEGSRRVIRGMLMVRKVTHLGKERERGNVSSGLRKVEWRGESPSVTPGVRMPDLD